MKNDVSKTVFLPFSPLCDEKNAKKLQLKISEVDIKMKIIAKKNLVERKFVVLLHSQSREKTRVLQNDAKNGLVVQFG